MQYNITVSRQSQAINVLCAANFWLTKVKGEREKKKKKEKKKERMKKQKKNKKKSICMIKDVINTNRKASLKKKSVNARTSE